MIFIIAAIITIKYLGKYNEKTIWPNIYSFESNIQKLII